MKFNLLHTDSGSKARAGVLTTDHGEIKTPIFMPVGTVGSVKGVQIPHLKEDIKAQIILGNTYHLYLRPGLDTLEKAGGQGEFYLAPGTSSWLSFGTRQTNALKNIREACAAAMAEGAAKALQVPIAGAVTGIAGPDGGTPEKPVGLVWIAVTCAGRTVTQECHFRGGRETVRRRTAAALFSLIREQLADQNR